MKIRKMMLLATGLSVALLVQAQMSIDIGTVLVEDAGNPADSSTGYGSVNYDYRIGTYEVTNSQYTAFLNAVASTDPHGLYNERMGASPTGGIARSGSSGSRSYSVRNGRGNNPVNYISFWDAARFANWLTTGDTETGVYNLGGVSTPSNTAITRDPTAWMNGGVAVASSDEWYKAAYYSGSPFGANDDGYWLYPTQSDSIAPTDANYRSSGPIAVGSYAPSRYGTFDQGGNLWEWTDTNFDSVTRGLRGGSFVDNDFTLRATFLSNSVPSTGSRNFGFRISRLAAPIPEASHAGMLMGSLALWMACLLKGRPPAGGQAAPFKL